MINDVNCLCKTPWIHRDTLYSHLQLYLFDIYDSMNCRMTNMAGKWRCPRCLADELSGSIRPHSEKRGGCWTWFGDAFSQLCFLGLVRKLGSHHPSSHVFFLENRPSSKKLYVTNSFICPRPPSFHQILDVQSIPQTCFLGNPLHTFFYLSLPHCIFDMFRKKKSRFMAGVFVFLGQESADREKVIPEKRKKLYGVSWSLSELSASRGGPRRH